MEDISEVITRIIKKRKLSEDGKKIAKTAHTYKSKTFTKATCTTPKIVVKFCTKCKKQLAFEKVGKPLGHYWHSWKKNPITGKVSRGCYHCKVRQYK